jgi:hypothetical protein
VTDISVCDALGDGRGHGFEFFNKGEGQTA